MLGLRTQPAKIEDFDSLNPLCAIVYHELENELSLESEFHQNTNTKKRTIEDYNDYRDAKQELGVINVMENGIFQLAETFSKFAEQHKKDKQAGPLGILI